MTDLQILLERQPAGLVTEISPRDPFARQPSKEAYFRVGQSALECVRIALLAARKEKVETILDFASGYGRVLRALQAGFPSAALTACDIKPDAIAFCAQTFGATAILSHEEPGEVRLPGQFDLIWCGSLFTHLDSERWERFLDLLHESLTPGGILIFTTAGNHVINRMRQGEPSALPEDESAGLIQDYERTGFGYRDYSAGSGLGLARCSPTWVCAQLQRRPGLRLLMYHERGWNDRQDVVPCVSQSDQDRG